MMNLSIKSLDRICLMGILLTAGALSGLAMSWRMKTEKRVAQEKMHLADRLNALRTVEGNVKHLQEVLDEARTKTEAFNNRIPQSAEFGEFFNQLDAMMKRRNLELMTVQPQPVVMEKTVVKMPIHLIFRGAFENVFAMIRDLETMDRTLVMDSLTVSKPDAGQECRVDMLANIFRR